MRNADHAEALRLMEQAALAIQGRYHPGRAAFYALARVQSELRKARREVAAQAAASDAATGADR